LWLFARLLAGGRHVGAAAVQMQACQQLQLQAVGEALPMLLDGEYLPPQSEVRISVLPGALAVLRLG
jgi:diacylglycerol kinase family enzyme